MKLLIYIAPISSMAGGIYPVRPTLPQDGPVPRTASRIGWLSKPASELLPELFANAVSINQMQVDMRDLCKQLGVREKATPHDLRRSFCSKVTQLGFGRDAMNRITNHREGGIADVYDRHKYAEENKRIMETVALHIVTIAEGGAGNILAFR